MTCLDITPLFMMLQYSVINNFDECIYKLVEKKIEQKTNFKDFLKNIELAKNYGDEYVNKLLYKLKQIIGNDSYDYIVRS